MNNEKLLKEYNCWRRGDSGYEMPDPPAIGIAIDSVIAQLAALKEENERLKARVAELEEITGSDELSLVLKNYMNITLVPGHYRICKYILEQISKKEPSNEEG